MRESILSRQTSSFLGLGHVWVIILGVLGRIVLAYAAGKLTTTMVQDMRNDLYAKLQEYSHHEYEQIGVSSLVTRLTSDAFVLMRLRSKP